LTIIAAVASREKTTRAHSISSRQRKLRTLLIPDVSDVRACNDRKRTRRPPERAQRISSTKFVAANTHPNKQTGMLSDTSSCARQRRHRDFEAFAALAAVRRGDVQLENIGAAEVCGSPIKRDESRQSCAGPA
jgi:hypothetical protein